MADDKKYYWLRLDRNFFKRHDIRIIENMENGKEYVLFYMKLLLESIDHVGNLRFNELIPYNESMLGTITNTNIDIVRSAIKLFENLDMLEILDDQTIYITDTKKMLGEAKSSDRVKRFREKQKQELLGSSYGEPCVYCGEPSTDLEHIIPKSKGGTNNQENLVPSCRLCNGKKYQKDVADFLNDERSNIKLERVLCNAKIMNVVSFDGQIFKMKRYRNVTETEIETEIELEKEIEIDIDKKKKSSHFVPPTLEEVKAYCTERKNNVDPHKFFDYFNTPDAQGRTWIDSKGNKVKNWKQKMITWEQHSSTESSKKPEQPKQTNKQLQYPQRSYSDKDYADLERKLLGRGL